MTGVLQAHARRYMLPIDTLNFSFKAIDAESIEDVKAAPGDGVFIEGLFLEGARFNRSKTR